MNTFRNIISNPQLTLYDYNLYSDDTKGHPQEYITYRKHIKQEYLTYINKVFELKNQFLLEYIQQTRVLIDKPKLFLLLTNKSDTVCK